MFRWNLNQIPPSDSYIKATYDELFLVAFQKRDFLSNLVIRLLWQPLASLNFHPTSQILPFSTHFPHRSGTASGRSSRNHRHLDSADRSRCAATSGARGSPPRGLEASRADPCGKTPTTQGWAGRCQCRTARGPFLKRTFFFEVDLCKLSGAGVILNRSGARQESDWLWLRYNRINYSSGKK